LTRRLPGYFGDMSGFKSHVPDAKALSWKVLSLACGVLAGLMTQRLLTPAWRGLRSATPPVPADRRSSWVDAVVWAVATGVGVGVARLLAIRTAAVVWEATTHEPPPEAALSGVNGS
jgi:hypothetical protein